MLNSLIKNLEDINDKTIKEKDINTFSKIFSDKIGIINALLKRNELEKYNLHMFQCLSAKAKILFGLGREVSSGGLGVDFSPKTAFYASMCEAIERYCMSYVNKDELLFCRFDELPLKFRPDKFYLYSDKQYKKELKFYHPKKSRIFWTKLSNFKNASRFLYWPASLVFLPFKYGREVAETSSTGVAANTSLSEAIINGILENIERDSLMINFLQRLNPISIDIGSVNDLNREIIEKIKKGYQIKIYKLYSDINIPIYLSFIWRKNYKGLHYGIGASADLSSEEAIKKSLKECLFTYFYSKNILDLKPKNRNDIKTLYEHFLYYQDNKFFNLLFESKTMKYEEQYCDLTYLLDELKKNNLGVFFKEITTSDIKKTGIRVVKVVIPGMIDLNKSYELRREAALRFWEVPKKLNLKYKKRLSSMPHPFP